MTVETFGTVLKTFQQIAIDNGVNVLSSCLAELSKIRGSKNYEQNKKLIVADIGALLLESPTGTGKTLMAGHIAERLSNQYKKSDSPKIIWFWFAPFAGLIDQSARTIRTEFGLLRTKSPATDRNIDDIHSGDVYVTTWASVAVANETSRKARTSTEEMPSIDELVFYARAQGYVIGAIIDEAHHTFRGSTQAFAFYRDILAPELTILATATPRDRDIETFSEAAGIKNLRRITISRQQGIDARLIKEGVKVAVFKAPDDVKNIIDFKRTALRQGVEVHKKIKQSLAEAGSSVVPLLLVQVDSEDRSVEQAITWLKDLGFRTEGDSELIRSHTADEPDPYLSAISADESVEVLVFKMAVALGFDAPRSFVLVSFRRNRDGDFGIQIVGRIMRVDRRLQDTKEASPLLNYGYVFLSDHAVQTGLSSAANRINAIKAELASVTTNVAVVTYDEVDNPVVTTLDRGHIPLFPKPQLQSQDRENVHDIPPKEDKPSGASLETDLWGGWGFQSDHQPPIDKMRNSKIKAESQYRYPLDTSLGAPKSFRRAMLYLVGVDIVSDIVGRFRLDGDLLLVAQQSATKIIMEEVEIFRNRKDNIAEIRADLAQKEIDLRAQQSLFRADDYDVVDVRELHAALIKRLKSEAETRGIGDLFDTHDKLRAGLHKILALRPQQLKRAVSEAVAQHIITEEALPLPSELVSDSELVPSRLNLYHVFPSDLNSWELPFAEYLDNDLSGTVLWWHRNPVHKPFSVKMPLQGQPNFFPDFVVGVKNRTRGNGILLIETKRAINDQERNALVKAQAEHPDYKKVMMLYWEEKREWMVVEYDPETDKNILDRVLRPPLMTTY